MSSRKLRARAKKLLTDGADVLPEHPREVVNPYGMAKDGKTWFDPRRHPKLMRK